MNEKHNSENILEQLVQFIFKYTVTRSNKKLMNILTISTFFKTYIVIDINISYILDKISQKIINNRQILRGVDYEKNNFMF